MKERVAQHGPPELRPLQAIVLREDVCGLSCDVRRAEVEERRRVDAAAHR